MVGSGAGAVARLGWRWAHCRAGLRTTTCLMCAPDGQTAGRACDAMARRMRRRSRRVRVAQGTRENDDFAHLFGTERQPARSAPSRSVSGSSGTARAASSTTSRWPRPPNSVACAASRSVRCAPADDPGHQRLLASSGNGNGHQVDADGSGTARASAGRPRPGSRSGGDRRPRPSPTRAVATASASGAPGEVGHQCRLVELHLTGAAVGKQRCAAPNRPKLTGARRPAPSTALLSSSASDDHRTCGTPCPNASLSLASTFAGVQRERGRRPDSKTR